MAPSLANNDKSATLREEPSELANLAASKSLGDAGDFIFAAAGCSFARPLACLLLVALSESDFLLIYTEQLL